MEGEGERERERERWAMSPGISSFAYCIQMSLLLRHSCFIATHTCWSQYLTQVLLSIHSRKASIKLHPLIFYKFTSRFQDHKISYVRLWREYHVLNHPTSCRRATVCMTRLEVGVAADVAAAAAAAVVVVVVAFLWQCATVNENYLASIFVHSVDRNSKK